MEEGANNKRSSVKKKSSIKPTESAKRDSVQSRKSKESIKRNSVQSNKPTESIKQDSVQSNQKPEMTPEKKDDETDFDLKDGLKLLLNLNVALNSKVDTFNSSLGSLTTCAYKIDEVLVDVDTRLRMLEGRGTAEHKSFLPSNILPSSAIGDIFKGTDQYSGDKLGARNLGNLDALFMGGERIGNLGLGGKQEMKGEGKYLDLPSVHQDSMAGNQVHRRESLRNRKSSTGSVTKRDGTYDASKDERYNVYDTSKGERHDVRDKEYDISRGERRDSRDRTYDTGKGLRWEDRDRGYGEGSFGPIRRRSPSQGSEQMKILPRTKRVAVKKLRKIPIQIKSSEATNWAIPPSKCKNCGRDVEKSDDLVTCILQIDPKQYLSESSRFRCRICGFSDAVEDNVRKHIYNHIKSSEFCHSLKCQKDSAASDKVFDNMHRESDKKFGHLHSIHDRRSSEGPELISLQTVLSVDQRPSRHSRVDKHTTPRCANCNCIFSYYVPLIKKIYEPYPCPPPSQDQYTMRSLYVCLVCGMKKPYRGHIELHAMGHIENNELYCRDCPLPKITHKVVPQDIGDKAENKGSKASHAQLRPITHKSTKIVTELRELYYLEQSLTPIAAAVK